jgi:multidrug resistance efflux pump
VEKLETMPRPKEVEAMEAQIEEAEVGVERVKRQIEDASIKAPASGTVVTAAREAGEYVNPGTPLFTLADLSEVYLTIYVSEPKLGHISLGQEAEISVDGMPGRVFSGTVSRIAEEAEFTPKNVQTQDARAELVYEVEITIDNSQGVFKIGMPADALLHTEAE